MKKTVLLLALALSVAACSQFGNSKQDSVTDKKIDQIIKKHYTQTDFWGALLVLKKDKIVFEKGYGYAQPEHDVLNTPETKFRIGSLTKAFTSMCILMLFEQKKLSLEDTVTKYIPSYKRAKEVNLKNLMNHSSGIPSFTELDFFKEIEQKPNREIDIIRRLEPLKLLFPAGKKQKYSNSNYIILAHVIEKVSGLPYKEFLRKKLLTPYDLKNTGYDSHHKIIKNRASGFVLTEEKKLVHANYIDLSVPSGAGAMYSTVRDMAKWYRLIRDHKIISKETTKKMLEPELKSAGYGWFKSKSDFGFKHTHSGGIDGFLSRIVFYPDSDLMIVLLSNVLTESNKPLTEITKDLAVVFH